MALKELPEQDKTFFTIVILLAYLVCKVICETGDCRQQEFRARSGNCVLCKQCGPGMELSKECGFGYGEDAQCVTCRPYRFKEDWGSQKCKPCLDCVLVNRFQKANCSAASDAICGDCLPGFYRKTKLVGFQDMECVPCGDPPPPYEPHCSSKVNLVKIPSTASSPRDTALAAVICSALATVLLALLILCIIYCKRQFMEKKPSWSLRTQDIQYNGSEMSCFDRPLDKSPRACCQCHQDLAQICDPVGETVPAFFGSLSQSICGEFSDAWPLMQNPICGDGISFCDSYPELTGEDIHSLSPEDESLDSNSSQYLVRSAVPGQAPSEDFAVTTDLFRYSSATEPVLVQETLPARSPLHQVSGDISTLTTQMSLQEA